MGIELNLYNKNIKIHITHSNYEKIEYETTNSTNPLKVGFQMKIFTHNISNFHYNGMIFPFFSETGRIASYSLEFS